MRRFFKRFALASCLLIAVTIVCYLAWEAVRRNSDRAKLRELLASLDASDPGWRLEDILARRHAEFPPDAENPITVTESVSASIPKIFREWQTRSTKDEREWLPEIELNRKPSHEDWVDAACTWSEMQDVIATARTLRTMPRDGGKVLVVGPNPWLVLLPHTQNVRESARVLQHDAIVSALNDDPKRALESLHACVNAGKAIAGEPTLISMLVRTAVVAVSVNTAERVLALTEPREGLAELQAVYLQEERAPRLHDGFRGERALNHRMFESIENGVLSMSQAMAGLGPLGAGGGPAFVSALIGLGYRSQIYGDHATSLRILTQFVEHSKQPPELQRALFRQVELPKGLGLKNLLTRLLVPAVEKVAEADLRLRTQLRCAVVAMGCERYRQKHGAWPRSLSDLSSEFLPGGVPLDPFSGKPLNYKVYPGGAVVYSVGLDGNDDSGNVSARGEKGSDYGFRLWDRDRRGLEPLAQGEPDAPAALPGLGGR